MAGHDERGTIVLRQKWSRGQVETRLSNIDPVHPPVDAELSLLAEAQRTLTCALSGGASAIERARLQPPDGGESRAETPNRANADVRHGRA